MAPEIQPVLDPADHALMLTPDQLRNQNSKNVNVSFLRKTQYMNSQNARANDGFINPNRRPSKAANKSAASALDPTISRDDPINIKRHIQRGFDIAYPTSSQIPTLSITAADISAWRTPVHPDNSKLKPVSYYPLLPDLDASTDVNGYVSLKFDKPPLPALSSTHMRDTRIDVALLHATPIASVEASWEAKMEAHKNDPDLYEHPGAQPYEWDFAVPKRVGKDIVQAVKRKLNSADPSRNEDASYEGLYEVGDPLPGQDVGIDYVKERSFGTVSSDFPNNKASTLRFVAVSLWDADSAPRHSRLRNEIGGLERAAYYYPIGQRTRVRTDRGKIGPRGQNAGDGAERWNHIKLKINEPGAREREVRGQHRVEDDEAFRDEYEAIKREADEENRIEAEMEAEADDGDTDVQMKRLRVDGEEHENDVEMSDPPPEEPARVGTNGFVEHDMEDED